VDSRSDVFALGAMLYAILAGEPPYRAADSAALVEWAKAGTTVPLRSIARWAPPALAAVCGKALAAKPEDRYATAAELADEVSRWLSGEPVQAYPEPLWQRAGRWVSRHRTLTASVAVGLVVALAAAVLLATWDARAREQRRIAEERRAAE